MTHPLTTRPVALVSLRDFLRAGAAAAVLGLAALFAAGQDDTPPDALIGYTESAPTCPAVGTPTSRPGVPSSSRPMARAGASWPRSCRVSRRWLAAA